MASAMLAAYQGQISSDALDNDTLMFNSIFGDILGASPPAPDEWHLEDPSHDITTSFETLDSSGLLDLDNDFSQPVLDQAVNGVASTECMDSQPCPDVPTSNHSINSDSEGDADFEDDLQKYNLRESARQNNAPMAWIDKDESGNYDPVEERREFLARRRATDGSTTVQREPRSRSRGKTRHAVYKSLETGRTNGAQLIFTIGLRQKLTGSSLIRATSLVADIPDHWPQEAYNYLDEDYMPNITGKRNDANGLSHEARERALQYGYDNNGDYIPYADPLGAEDTLYGHPSARGCVQCRRGGWASSLLGNKYAWPCETCVVDNEDCQLITPPARKATCEGCKHRKVKCSFRDQLVQPTKCNECASLGVECIAGPAPGYEQQLTRYGEENLERPLRFFAGCTSCREQKIRCSLKKTDAPPCASCVEDRTPCIFESIYKLGDKGKAKAVAYAAQQDEHTTMINQDTDYDSEVLETLDPRPLPPDTSTNALQPVKAPCFDRTLDKNLPTFHTITAFCHPITFNCDTTNNQFSDPFQSCSFCREPMFAVYGYYEFVNVRVQENYNGLCYEEKSKRGYYAHNKQPTRICTQHTLERYHIINCKHKTIAPVHEQDATTINESFLGPASEVRVDWLCSLCPSPMAFRCTMSFDTDCLGEQPEVPGQGCGLQLCSYCYQNLVGRFGGRLQDLVEDMKAGGAEYELGRRADIELLAATGLLVGNVHADFGL